jgi:sigma-E factor negative regulatory protein RseC
MSDQSNDKSPFESPLHRHEGKISASTDSVIGMTVEKARVISVEPSANGGNGALWVETFQQSTCGSCEAKGACGQGVLGRWLSRGTHCIRVLCDKGQADFFTVGQWV